MDGNLIILIHRITQDCLKKNIHIGLDIFKEGFANPKISFIFGSRSPHYIIAIQNLKCLVMILEVVSQLICKAFLFLIQLWNIQKNYRIQTGKEKD